ncbi:MAG: phospholipid carrier-dependent glycosyltransferase [Planctomycetaceae bacterium]|jgi:hypothetical protein|nr:phospholipid carrier-dependent glycosyltransferase [Planctomycetaceae bacterium]
MHKIVYPFIAGYLVFILLLQTSAILPATWDEGEFARRVNSVQPADTFISEGHPQFPVILSAAGRLCSGKAYSKFEDKNSYRYGIIAFFSLAMGAVFYRLQKEFNVTTAIFGVVSVLLIPRLFAHCQIAAWDSTLTAAWLLTWAAESGKLITENKKWKILRHLLTGFLLGLTISSKFSGLAVLFPFYILAAIKTNIKKLSAVNFLLSILIVHCSLFITFTAVNPCVWHNPFGGIADWFCRNTHRDINIAVLFFGTMYDLHHSLPWWNTAAWTAITVPVGILFFFFCGLFVFWKDKSKRFFGLTLILNMLPLLVIRAFPGTPVHDGERMFLPAFAFLGIIAGIGAGRMTNDELQITDKVKKGKILRRVVAGLIYSTALANLFLFVPQWLSFYNAAIGGLQGAVKAGMEPAYWWDGFDKETIDWLYEHSEDGDNIAFSAGSVLSVRRSVVSLKFNGKTANIRRTFVVIPPDGTSDDLFNGRFRYYVLQCRPSAVFSRDEELMRTQTPVFEKKVRGVPVLKIYAVHRRDKPAG